MYSTIISDYRSDQSQVPSNCIVCLFEVRDLDVGINIFIIESSKLCNATIVDGGVFNKNLQSRDADQRLYAYFNRICKYDVSLKSFSGSVSFSSCF